MKQEKKIFYTEPTIELLMLDVDDIIRTSGFAGKADMLTLDIE